jgi:hypothetical protein
MKRKGQGDEERKRGGDFLEFLFSFFSYLCIGIEASLLGAGRVK